MSRDRINSIINASKIRMDFLYTELEKELTFNSELTIKCHKSCASSYTSKDHLKRVCKKRNVSISSHNEPPMNKRRLSADKFIFKLHCIFCGEICKPRDKKNPSRWREIVKCTTADQKGRTSLKENILLKCKERGDAHASNVLLRISGALADLHASDAQYHKDCHKMFFSERNIKAAQHNEKYTGVDPVLLKLIHKLDNNPSHIWNTVELYNEYLNERPSTFTIVIG